MLFQNAQTEAGVTGRIISLSGSPGKLGFGRQIVTSNGTLTGATTTPISGVNNSRIAAIVVNTGSNPMFVSFGGTATIGIPIAANGYLQIDALFPWTGAIVLYSASGTTYNFTEISNQD